MAVRMLLIVVGLKREARIAAAPSARFVLGGGRSDALAGALDGALADGRVEAVLSFGVAGGLDPRLRVGDVLVARAVVTLNGAQLDADRGWSDRLRAACAGSDGSIVGADAVVETVADKRRLRIATGAAAVDMESHLAASAAAARSLPFAAMRVISDHADHTLPRAASVGLGGDGGVDAAAVVRELIRAPSQLAALIRTGRDAGRAFQRLKEARSRAGDAFEYIRRCDLPMQATSVT